LAGTLRAYHALDRAESTTVKTDKPDTLRRLSMSCTSRKVLTLLALGAIGVFAIAAVSEPVWAGCGNCGGGEGHQHKAQAKEAGQCPKAQAKSECTKDRECRKADGKCTRGEGKCGSCEKGMGKGLQQAMTKIEAAEKALEAGDTKAALAAVKEAKAELARMNEARKHKHHAKADSKDAAQADQPDVVNSTCPIMGSKIDAGKVPQHLYRVHDGKGVGFCCGGCPKAWDKLSDEEKSAKLKAAM
jgi:hypothetical protein